MAEDFVLGLPEHRATVNPDERALRALVKAMAAIGTVLDVETIHALAEVVRCWPRPDEADAYVATLKNRAS